MWHIIPLVIFIINTTYINGFTVDIFNISRCRSSYNEKGDLRSDISTEDSIDQLYSATFTIPKKLNQDAYVQYVSHAWDEDIKEWVFLFYGSRSVCNSIIKSIPYKRFRESVEPKWPMDCPIHADTYELTDFPISGQYAVMSDIRNGYPITRHKVELWAAGDLILCREIFTISST